jgi:hypothetical protein
MAANYVLLERIELNASASSVSFQNIPQSGYTDLKVVVSSRTTDTTTAGSITFNGTGTGFTGIRLFGSGSSVASGSSTAAVLTNSSGYTASTYSNSEIYIPNYAGSNYKSVSVDGVSENNATESYAMFNAILWSNTAAITSVTLAPAGGSFVQYSTFSLYGLAAVGTTPAIAPKASGGNVIDFDGTYWIHTFTSSGTFTPATGLTCDYLVVAGGGGGGANGGGGGGAGGLRSTVTATGGGGSLESALSAVSNTSYTVTIGAGGSGNASSAPSAGNGSNSVFSSVTSIGGGAGGGSQTGQANINKGGNGGSGGGNRENFGTGGSGTANQGYNGGNTPNVYPYPCGGGGGAGAIGQDAGTTNAGNGGNGVATSISGSSVTYAGGGGGGVYVNGAGANGTGGSGGGGAGNASPVAGTTNTGGGGGGISNTSGNGANGGSGIVIIRYLAA